MLSLRGAVFVAVTGPLGPLCSDTAVTSQPSPAMTEPPIGIPSCRTCEYTLSPLLVVSRVTGTFYSLQPTRPWCGIHVSTQLCDRSSFVFVFALVPGSVYCLSARPGPTSHVPMCSVSFSDEADRGVAVMFMFAFCVDRVFGRMMVNARDGRERERERVVVLLMWCLLFCLRECVWSSLRAFSSDGRAPASHAGGRGIDTPNVQSFSLPHTTLHHTTQRIPEMVLFTRVPPAAPSTIRMDTSPCARARSYDTNTDLPLQPMLSLRGAVFVAVTGPLGPLCSDTAVTSQPSPAMTEPPIGIPSCRTCEYTLSPLLVVSRVTGTFYSLQPTRPWCGIHVSTQLCDRSSFVFVFALVPGSVYCLSARPGPTSHVPMCSVSFSDEADRGVAVMFMFAFCVDRVFGRMMVNARDGRERERERVVVLLMWCLLFCLRECVWSSLRAFSSDGRAPASHAGGRGIDTPNVQSFSLPHTTLHHTTQRIPEMVLFTRIPPAAPSTIRMDTSPCARARSYDTNTDLPLQPMLSLRGAVFVAVTGPLGPLCSDTAVTSQPSPAMTEPPIGIPSCRTCEYTLSPLLVVSRVTGTFYSLQPTRPWCGIHVSTQLCDRSSFVFVFALVPGSVYCLSARPGPTSHVPMCSVSFSDEADRGVAVMFMFAFCVDRVFGRMMVNARDGRERERERVVVLLMWCLLFCLRECVWSSLRAFSSDGRAPASHAGGRGIDTPNVQSFSLPHTTLHHTTQRIPEMVLFTRIPPAAPSTIRMDTSPCARARSYDTNTDLPLQPMLSLRGAVFVAVTGPLGPLCSDTAVTSQPSPAMTEPPIGIPSCRTCEYTLSPLLVVSRVTGTFYSLQPTRPWCGIHVSTQLCDRSSFVFVFALVPGSVYCLSARPGPTSHVPMCSVSFSDEAERGVAVMFMFAFCVDRVFGRMMVNARDGRERERERVVVLLMWCLLFCLRECVWSSLRAFSSDGRAPASHAGGRGIDTPNVQSFSLPHTTLHHTTQRIPEMVLFTRIPPAAPSTIRISAWTPRPVHARAVMTQTRICHCSPCFLSEAPFSWL